jgi:hypothetical protein
MKHPRLRNPGTRLGRPPKMRSTVADDLAPDQAPTPMSDYDSATPASAFRRGGSVNGFSQMPKHHPDPGFCGGGSTRRR